MKRIIVFVAVLFAIGFLISYAKGQTQLTTDSTTLPKSEKETQHNWKTSLEFSYLSKFENDTKDTILDGPTSLSTFTFHKEQFGGTTKLTTYAGYAPKRSLLNHGYFGFKAERIKPLGRRFELSYGTKLDFTRSLRYGSIFGGTAIKLGEQSDHGGNQHSKTGIEGRIFTKIDYYFPVDNQLHFNRGTAWTSGIEGRLENENFIFEPSGRIIFNSGTMHPARRTLFNWEALLGLKFNKFCLGGGLDFTQRLAGEWEHDQSVIGKFFIRYN